MRCENLYSTDVNQDQAVIGEAARNAGEEGGGESIQNISNRPTERSTH